MNIILKETVMKTLQEIKTILQTHKDKIQELYHVKEIGIFGSFIREENTADSDLDILVEFLEPVSLFEFIDLEEYIQNMTGIKVDLVSRKGLKPRIGRYILDEVVYI